MSQESVDPTAVPMAADGDRTPRPNYKEDAAVFKRFIEEHTITVHQQPGNRSPADNDEEDDEDDFVPTAHGQPSIRRIPCYLPHLQRIRRREFYESTGRAFIVEVPLQEMIEWDPIKGEALANRATLNTVRYAKIFSSVLDDILLNLPHNDPGDASDAQGHSADVRESSWDLLNQQRVAQQQQAQQAQQQEQAGADPLQNPFVGNSTVQQDAGGGGGSGDGGSGGTTPNAGNGNNTNAPNATMEIPPIVLRRYELRILPKGRPGRLPPFDNQHHGKDVPPQPRGCSLRQIRAPSLGKLVTVKGMVVRASDVKPCTVVATYACDRCGAEVYQPLEGQREFLPARACPSPLCQSAGSRDTLQLQTRTSKFIKFQEVKLQELPNQVPMGHVPRSLTVYCRGELTRQVTAGDVVTLDGIFLPQKVGHGYRALRAGLVATTYLEAQNMMMHKKSYDDADETLSPLEKLELDTAIQEVTQSDDPIGRLARSIAPEIFGHEDIKRALLLQLVGGCARSLPDGMKIRGDINLCLMGDPGVAKSQLLKHVSSIAPRGVYTTGKGSSGVGLTAAVTKDTTTGEMSLEGGALVLADRGICCIDEFDKMDEADRTAIHEVMEQQTVSIAKAGIVATLNARAAVLAAANPLYGRYHRGKSLSENVNLPNSLLSRFDLLFLVLDVADIDKDMALARHVTLVHQSEGRRSSGMEDEDKEMEQEEKEDDDEDTEVVPPRVLREYIARARRHQPFMPADVAPYVVEAYVTLRQGSVSGNRRSKESDQTVLTARQLLSILRLSQALARLRFADLVAREDVDEAIRLTHCSKASLENDKPNSGNGGDVTSKIYQLIRDYANTLTGTDVVKVATVQAMVIRKGYSQQQFQTCLDEYQDLQVWQMNRTGTEIFFL